MIRRSLHLKTNAANIYRKEVYSVALYLKKMSTDKLPSPNIGQKWLFLHLTQSFFC